MMLIFHSQISVHTRDYHFETIKYCNTVIDKAQRPLGHLNTTW